jgi:hypothetical protein
VTLSGLALSLLAVVAVSACEEQPFPCDRGSEACDCLPGDGCDPGLRCSSNLCVDPDPRGLAEEAGDSGVGPPAGASNEPGDPAELNSNDEGRSTPPSPPTGSTSGSMFGAPCEADSECAGFACVGPDSDSFGGDGPPGGLCTRDCTGQPELCDQLDVESVCVATDATHAYCIQRCEYGPSSLEAFDPGKCFGRSDFACAPSPILPPQDCNVDRDCPAGGNCLAGLCSFGMCLPRCAVDAQCPEGRYCDPLWGSCTDQPPRGLRFGSECDPDASDPDEQCSGLCDTRDDGVSVCEEPCTTGAIPACGFDGESGAAAFCIGSSRLPDSGYGDVGSCVGLCDCHDECRGPHRCLQLSKPVLGRVGVCVDPSNGDWGSLSPVECETTPTE